MLPRFVYQVKREMLVGSTLEDARVKQGRTTAQTKTNRKRDMGPAHKGRMRKV